RAGVAVARAGHDHRAGANLGEVGGSAGGVFVDHAGEVGAGSLAADREGQGGGGAGAAADLGVGAAGQRPDAVGPGDAGVEEQLALPDAGVEGVVKAAAAGGSFDLQLGDERPHVHQPQRPQVIHAAQVGAET